MNNQIIKLSTAKLAKEIGFPQRENENDEHSSFVCGQCWVMDLDGATNIWKHSNAYAAWAAPTQYQIQKWLRDEHNIHILIDIDIDNNNNDTIDTIYSVERKWYYIIKPISINGDLYFSEFIYYYDSYEEALENAIVEALENLK